MPTAVAECLFRLGLKEARCPPKKRQRTRRKKRLECPTLTMQAALCSPAAPAAARGAPQATSCSSSHLAVVRPTAPQLLFSVLPRLRAAPATLPVPRRHGRILAGSPRRSGATVASSPPLPVAVAVRLHACCARAAAVSAWEADGSSCPRPAVLAVVRPPPPQLPLHTQLRPTLRQRRSPRLRLGAVRAGPPPAAPRQQHHLSPLRSNAASALGSSLRRSRSQCFAPGRSSALSVSSVAAALMATAPPVQVATSSGASAPPRLWHCFVGAPQPLRFLHSSSAQGCGPSG